MSVTREQPSFIQRFPLGIPHNKIDGVCTGGRDSALAGKVTVRRNSNYGRSLSMAMFPTQQ